MISICAPIGSPKFWSNTMGPPILVQYYWSSCVPTASHWFTSVLVRHYWLTGAFSFDQERNKKDLEHAATEQRSTSVHATANKQTNGGDGGKRKGK